MELNRIELLLEKDFKGKTSIAEENELKNFFSETNIAPHLKQYQPLFSYFSNVKQENLKPKILLKNKNRNITWLSIAASILVLCGIGSYIYFNNNQKNVAQSNLGTFNDPIVAFIETQKALTLIANNVNTGIESVQYINEYERSKNLIFKQTKNQ